MSGITTGDSLLAVFLNRPAHVLVWGNKLSLVEESGIRCFGKGRDTNNQYLNLWSLGLPRAGPSTALSHNIVIVP
jgi:hypothetical protein